MENTYENRSLRLWTRRQNIGEIGKNFSHDLGAWSSGKITWDWCRNMPRVVPWRLNMIMVHSKWGRAHRLVLNSTEVESEGFKRWGYWNEFKVRELSLWIYIPERPIGRMHRGRFPEKLESDCPLQVEADSRRYCRRTGLWLQHQYIVVLMVFGAGKGQIVALNHQIQGRNDYLHGIKSGVAIRGPHPQ